MADFYLMRFEDGPLEGMTNTVALEHFGWPLPDRVAVLGASEIGLAVLPADGALLDDGALIYEKVSESKLPNDDSPHLARGAVYRLETDAEA